MGSQDTIRQLEKELIHLRKQSSASADLEAKVVDLEKQLALKTAAAAQVPALKREIAAQKATIEHLMNDLSLKSKKLTDE